RDYKVTGVQTCALPISCMPEACSRTFLCRAFAVTPRFTLDIASLLQVRRQAHDGARVRRRCAVLAAVLALALGALVLEQMGAEEIGRASCRERVEVWVV